MMRVFLIIVLLFSSFVTIPGYAQTENDASEKFELAKVHFSNGEFKQSIAIYDEILESHPDNISTLKMKGIAQSNLEYHEKSLKQFFKILQYRPDDVISLVGMSVGFGYLGEYQEATKYIEKAKEKSPNNIVINNYAEFIDRVNAKYPYIPTEKPKGFEKKYTTEIPSWVKNNAGWWAQGQIKDSDFTSALLYLIENKIIKVPPVDAEITTNQEIPEWVKNNAGWWAENEIEDNSFVQGIQYMMEKGIIVVNIKKSSEEIKKEKDYEYYLFERYIQKISKNVSDEKRYIEFPNPSRDVIKKFLRDYIKWNFENEAKSASSSFPDPTFEIIDNIITIKYKVFINEQPSGLPLDHVSTLQDSLSFWEQQELSSDDKKARIVFEVTNKKHEANVWITWIVRELCTDELQEKQMKLGVEQCNPNEILGHAHLGKGVVEVTLGDYNCDASFQLYDVDTVEQIMTHELGHSVGLTHTNDSENIMYPSLNPNYAYCILDVD